MPHSVQAVQKEFKDDLAEGDDIIINDPYRGGTHLPDIPMASPMFFKENLVGFSANRAPHSDDGGVAPGSMPAQPGAVNREGFRVPPTTICKTANPNGQAL